MDRFDLDRRSGSRTSSVSGRSAHSERSWNSLTPQEQELADSLQTQQLRLELMANHKSSDSASSSGSEARDRLKEAEARERVIEFQQRAQGSHAGRSSPHSENTGNTPSLSPRAADTIRDYVDRVSALQGDRDNVKGALKQKSNPRSGSASSIKSGKSSGSGSDANPATSNAPTGQQLQEMQDKIKGLETALKDRDSQNVQMREDCYNIDEQNQARLAALQLELRDAMQAKKDAEDKQIALEVKVAGEQARYTSSLSYEKAENFKHLEMHRSNEAKASEARSELETARKDLDKARKREIAETGHQVRMKEVSDQRIEALETMLKSANDQLALERRGAGSQDACAREEALQDKIAALVKEAAEDRKEMSAVRLELLGLKKRNAIKAIDHPEPTPAPRGRGGKARGKGRGRAWGKSPLEIIDEEEDGYEDLPQVEDETWASECVSSDAGDVDELTNPDTTRQSDMMSKLLRELTEERKTQQNLREDHASKTAEQTEQIEQLQKQLMNAGTQQEEASAENARLREKGNQDKIKQLRVVDDLQLKVRDLEETMYSQFAKMKEQTDKEEEQESAKKTLQETIQMQTEALRISSLRLQDALQQHQNEAVRQLQRVNSLKLALALERKRGSKGPPGSLALEVSSALEPDDVVDAEEVLETRVKELEEERNLLLNKIEVKDVQHQVQLEDTFRDHAQRLREQQTKFEEQIAEIRARYEQLLKKYPMIQGHDQVLESETATGIVSTTTVGSSTGTHGEIFTPGGSDIVSSSNDAEASETAPQSGHLASVCSTPVARSVVSTGGTASGADDSTCADSRTRSMIWAVLGLVPNAAAVLCTFENLVIERVTARAGAIFSGLDLIGMSFFSLLRERSNAAILRRMMLVNQSMADSSQAEIPAFAAKTLGRFDLLAMAGKALDVVLSMAHLPDESKGSAAGQDERRVILLITEQAQQPARGEFSVASSDICPSDSVSVGRRRPQFVSSEVQRTQLRASFFSSMKSRLSSASSAISSPRNSVAPE